MTAMEGVATAVAVKLPSFKIIRRTTTLNWRSSRSFRSFSVSASTLRKGDPSASASVSLGDLTRPDFPILNQEVNGSKLVYLDNARRSPWLF